MGITLYALDGCPYCESVMDALEAHDIEYDVHWVDGRFSERNEVKAVSGQRGVPVLEHEEAGVVMPLAENIETYIERSLA
ncbi:MAG: glutaredoxin family protein [Halodesulfurarchaeum sp.]